MRKLFYIGALSALLLAACGNDESNSSSASEATQKEETSNKKVYFENDEAKLNDLKIKITDTKVIPVGEKGNEYGEKPVFAIWYDTTNLSDKDINPSTAWVVVFEAIQDNDPNAVNTLNVGILPDEQFLDAQLQTIKKDGTVSSAIAYELDDLETPVKLVAQQGIGGKVLGEIEYPIK